MAEIVSKMGQKNYWIWEARAAGILATIVLMIWCCWSVFAFDGPVRFEHFTARIIGLSILGGILCLEYKKPWWGVALFIFLLPNFHVFREILRLHVRPWMYTIPTCWGGPLAAALATGIFWREEMMRPWRMKILQKVASEKEQKQNTSALESSESTSDAIHTHQTKEGWPGNQSFRYALWFLAAVLLIGALVGWSRAGGLPASWDVQAVDWRQMLALAPKDSLRPIAVLVEWLPPLLLGIILLTLLRERATLKNMFPASERLDQECKRLTPPLLPLLILTIASGMLAGIQVFWQAGSASNWHFWGVDQSIYAKQLQVVKWSFDLGPPAGPFTNRNTTGPFLVLSALCCLGFISRARPHWVKVISVASLVFLAGSSVLTGSRNGLLLIILAVGSATLIKAGWKRVTCVAGVVGLLLCTLIWIAQSPPTPAGTETGYLTKKLDLVREGKWVEVTNRRSALYAAALDIFKTHPITGSGLGTFAMQTSYESEIGHRHSQIRAHGSAHSVPLHLLAETGVTGAVAWLALFIFLPLIALVRWRTGNYLALVMLAFGLSNVLDTLWMAPGMGTWWVIFLAVGLSVSDEEKKSLKPDDSNAVVV